MKQYLDLLRQVREHGTFKSDRTGTGTYSVFGYQMRFDLADGFPLVTTKKCHLKSIIHELLWFLKGDTNIRYLKDNGVSIWDEWADENGDLGPVYGKQWRSWLSWNNDGEPTKEGSWQSMYLDQIDQITQVIEQLKTTPDSRRLIVSAWNVGQLHLMALAPCHVLFQFYSAPLMADELEAEIRKRGLSEEYLRGSCNVGMNSLGTYLNRFVEEHQVTSRRLSCQLYQRSADIFLGVPFNIASYALLTLMIAQVTNHAPGEFIWTGGDCHLYANHLEQADLQLSREPLPLPKLLLAPHVQDIDDFVYDDFTLLDYQHHPAIKAPVAV